MKKLLVCLLLVGCAGDDDSGGGGSPVALDNFGTAIGTASCHKQFECCSDAEIMAQYMGITYMGQPITTEQQCVDFTTGFLATFLVDEYKTSLAAGRIEYDAAAAGNCISVMERISCADYAAAIAGTGKPTALVSCKSPVTGKVENGGVCAQDYECTSDNCVKTGSSNDGTCQPIPTAGQPCDFTCADGLYCDFDTTTAMETCQAKKANDAQCDSDDQCTSDNCDKTTRVCTTKPIVCDGR